MMKNLPYAHVFKFGCYKINLFEIDLMEVLMNALHSGRSGYYRDFNIMGIPMYLIRLNLYILILEGPRSTKTHCIYQNLDKVYSSII